MYVIDSLIEGNPAKAMDAVRHLILPSIVLAAFTMGPVSYTHLAVPIIPITDPYFFVSAFHLPS